MKILVIMGSPRKGESYKVVQQVESLMKDMGDVAFDYLWLKDVNFGKCCGCHACIRFGEQKCPLKDDLASIEARMLEADGVIFATPVYALQVSYYMKILFDRFCYMWHRPRMFGKFAMGIASGGGQFKETLGYIKQNTSRWGFTYVSQIGAPHPDALKPKMRANLARNIEKATRAFYAAVRDQRVPRPPLGELIWFRIWRLNAIAAKEFTPADFKHWTEKGWFQQEYYTVAPVNAVNRVLARGMEKIIQLFMRGVYEGY